MSKLLMLKGLPASGKSTYAKKLVDSGGWVRVNKDDLRAMMHNSKWSKMNEKLVLSVRDEIIEDALSRGQSVVVDDTNFGSSHKNRLKNIARAFSANFETKEFLDVSVEECIKRDLARSRSVGEKVIRSMYDKFLKPPVPVYVPPEGKPPAIIVDVDGTLAHGVRVHRGPYDWDKVGDDTVDPVIAEMVNAYSDKGYNIIVMTGRDGVCAVRTVEWVYDNGIACHYFFHRPEGDCRKDSVVKMELFDKFVREEFNVKFVLDDRDQVVSMWRSLGLKVLQVAEGNF